VSRTDTEAHAALMDRIYRHQRYIYDFTRKYYLFGRDSLIESLALKPGERLVEIGCGTARNLIRIAQRYPGAELFGLDASAEMLKTAAQAIERAGLTSRITLAQGYAEALSPAMFGESKSFDRAVFSYSLSMIPDWKQALKAADSNLAAGGQIFVVDFGDLTGLGRIGERLLKGWLALFHVEPRAEILLGLESTDAQKKLDLRILFGRYAFVWSCGKDRLTFL
jgi:S-adenosylmethionine-diacylgycerolhomoserine-N-methlytransferase